MKQYLSENWDGWPLHALAALALGWLLAGTLPLAYLIMNTVWWPAREALQHHGFKSIWTPHRMLEWGAPVLMGLACYIGWG